jgi:hypothetical protein
LGHDVAEVALGSSPGLEASLPLGYMVAGLVGVPGGGDGAKGAGSVVRLGLLSEEVTSRSGNGEHDRSELPNVKVSISCVLAQELTRSHRIELRITFGKTVKYRTGSLESEG